MEVSFFHIFIKPRSAVTDEQVKKQMNLALDWYKYSDYCWVVKTTSDSTKWQTRLKPLVEPSGALLIFKLDLSERHGWMAKGFWSWLRGDKPASGSQTKT